MKIYSVYELPSDKDKAQGFSFGACITDGQDKEKTIEAAADYYCQRMIDDGEYGEGERDAILCVYDNETDDEIYEPITLKWHAESDDYDGGRFDYLAGIGAVRSF